MRKTIAVVLIVVAGVFMLSASSVMAQLPCTADFDCDQDVDATDVSTFLSQFGRSIYNDPCPDCYDSPCPCSTQGCDPPAPLSKTGQTTQYGGQLDDGYFQKGVIRPDPRFIDNGDGTVTDLLHGLVWWKRGDCGGLMDWSTAFMVCNTVPAPGFTECGLSSDDYSPGDFRLPNLRELQSLIDYGENTPALSVGHPFTGANTSQQHWTSSTRDNNTAYAWGVYLGSGRPYYLNKTNDTAYVICVTDLTATTTTTIPHSAPVEKTGQTTSYATGDDGDLQKGVAWPNPRFTDNADGTVTDNLTNLVWLKDANCFGQRTWNNALSDSNGLASGSCGLTDGSGAGDWRLPNRRELFSLIHDEYYNPALPNTAGTGQWSQGDPFNNVQTYLYWSSTTYTGTSPYAWYVFMYYGIVDGSIKSNLYYVWPVRGGH